MTTITIPKSLAHKELVIIPREEYDTLRRLFRVSTDSPAKSALDRDLRKAIKEYREGKFVGPFTSARALMRSLLSNK